MARGTAVSALSAQALARAALTYLAEPGDPVLGALLEIGEPAELLAAIRAGMLPGTGTAGGDSPARRRALDRAHARQRIRLPDLPGDAATEETCRDGIRLACPGDPQWPAALDELGAARPYALWLRGRADLGLACQRSASIMGSRAATGYGAHVASELAADLAEQGWPVVSGGPYDTDAGAHKVGLPASKRADHPTRARPFGMCRRPPSMHAYRRRCALGGRGAADAV